MVCPKGRQVLSIDLPGHGERRDRGGELLPWTAVPEIQTALDWAGRRWESVSLRANSIGAYLAMLAWEDPARALLVSPILDMEELIRTMMGWAGVTEEELRARGEDPHLLRPDPVLGVPDLGAEAPGPHMELSHPHPLWERRQHDARRTAEEYARRHNAELTVAEGGEHWFHTPEQLAAMREWAEREP